MIEILRDYNPKDAIEVKDLEYMLEAYSLYQDKLYGRNPHMHFTASAIIVNQDYTKTLMIYHNIYDSWAWVGGHMDFQTDFLEVALKEAKEETGIQILATLKPSPISIEVLPVWQHEKHGKVISSHLHLNVSYLFMADEKAPLIENKVETQGVKWIPIDEIETYVNEEKMLPIYHKILKRGKTI